MTQEKSSFAYVVTDAGKLYLLKAKWAKERKLEEENNRNIHQSNVEEK